MKLLQAKLRGTGPLINSNWFQLSNRLNQFHFANPAEGTLFLRSLQSLHPLFSCTEHAPFKNLPHFEQRDNYQKHIQPSKRTIALAVFAATPDLVHELGELDQNLYETDRIELGRRLDYSRWLNFVEISSSTRWKEVKENISALLESPGHEGSPHNETKSLVATLGPTDRIKGKLAEALLLFLEYLDEDTKKQEIYRETVELIKRDDHFQTARHIVLKHIPLLIYFNANGDISPFSPDLQYPNNTDHVELKEYMKRMGFEIPSPTRDSILERITSGIELSLSASTRLSRMKPIFLFDSLEENIPVSLHNKLQQLIMATAEEYQCLYMCRQKDFFSPEATGKNYSYQDLQITSNLSKGSSKS